MHLGYRINLIGDDKPILKGSLEGAEHTITALMCHNIRLYAFIAQPRLMAAMSRLEVGGEVTLRLEGCDITIECKTKAS